METRIICEKIIPKKVSYPIIITIPHSGTQLPLVDQKWSEEAKKITDTDWFVDELYSFAENIGVILIRAVYSRYVVDLNRPPEKISLYKDGRKETTVIPYHSFLGENLYLDSIPDQDQIKNRIRQFYTPWYEAINHTIRSLKADWEHVLIFDGHSIRRKVSTISNQAFPDLIIGTADGASADHRLIDSVIKNVEQSEYSFSINKPFKGGHMTRFWGKPENGNHAIQLEMSQDIYMQENPPSRDKYKAEKLQYLLQQTIEDVGKILIKINRAKDQ